MKALGAPVTKNETRKKRSSYKIWDKKKVIFALSRNFAITERKRLGQGWVILTEVHIKSDANFILHIRFNQISALHSANAGRMTNLAPVKSVRFSELILWILLCEFRFTVLFPLGCGTWSGFMNFPRSDSSKCEKKSFICMYPTVYFWLRLTKTSLTLINRTRLRTKGQSAGYPQAQIGITSNSFQRRAP